MTETNTTFEREKWEADVARQNKELALKEKELDLRVDEARRAHWNNPVALAIVAATVAALGNIILTFVTGVSERKLEATKTSDQQILEEQKAESERILEMIKTGNNTEKAADNLQFLVDTKLIQDPLRTNIATYLKSRKKGEGPALPASSAIGVVAECAGPATDGKACGPNGAGRCSGFFCVPR